MYGNFRGRLFKYDYSGECFEVLEDDAKLFTRDQQGNLYFAHGADLYL
ncbi:hypothetical protein ACFQZR_13870 [Paenibacillus sp. GCM10027629]